MSFSRPIFATFGIVFHSVCSSSSSFSMVKKWKQGSVHPHVPLNSTSQRRWIESVNIDTKGKTVPRPYYSGTPRDAERPLKPGF
ncbi:hypothetical protein BDV36DRAFT_259331 [Aspergillus pseudocaelatus]|uniref:Secreted protein n=1 Tax=Aspergillus pseudocaelatus TaxID=1825620 RepID=A0ABQ6WHR5_9EURO|nr:hypothetical protein BDV36DRAFT_259331 [Aspergillus pseudocaelatus]